MADDSAPENRAPRRRRWSPRRWRVRTKVVATILVPTLLASVLAVLLAREQVNRRDDLYRVAAGARVIGDVTDLVDRLQVERSRATEYIAVGRQGGHTLLDAATASVDEGVETLRGEVGSVSGLDAGLRDRYSHALDRLDALAAARAVTLGTSFPAQSIVDVYNDLISPLLAVPGDLAGVTGQSEIVDPATSLAALGRAKEQIEVQHALLLTALTSDRLPVGTADAVRSAVAEQDAAVTEFEASATADQVQFFADTVAGVDIDQRVRILTTSLLRDGLAEPLGLDEVSFGRAADTTRQSYRVVENRLLADLQGSADQQARQAATSATVALLAVVAALILAIVLAIAIARSLVTPLRRLRYSALDIAERRLPESVRRLESGADDQPDVDAEAAAASASGAEDGSEEEIGEVARAFDTVHREAVRLAGEQARMRTNLNALFVNLSRRSQGLVERQLLLIDTLEGQEENPDVLADLFRLDHLATRMRRNSENLLVLGGATPSRGQAEPVPLDDLIRAAVGEVENYQRIGIGAVPAVRVRGGPADDLTHLLAELLDNATAFSPPDSEVTVRASRSPDGGLVIEIVDEGLGLDPEDLAAANLRIEEPVLIDPSVPRQMGLFVVGALARRHGILARLLADDGGTTASVQVPGPLLMHSVRVDVIAGPGLDGAPSSAGARLPQRQPSTVSDLPQRQPSTVSDLPVRSRPERNWALPAAAAPHRTEPDTADPDTAETAAETETADPDPTDWTGPVVARQTRNYDPIATIPTPLPRSGVDADRTDRADDLNDEPIYAEMCSAWFTASSPEAPPDPHAPAVPDDAESAPRADGEGTTTAGVPAWASEADHGWEAVAARRRETVPQRTDAGLPRRSRGAALVPGAAHAAPAGLPTPRPTIDAEQLRERTRGFHEGARRARLAVEDTGVRTPEPASGHSLFDPPDPSARTQAGDGTEAVRNDEDRPDEMSRP